LDLFQSITVITIVDGYNLLFARIEGSIDIDVAERAREDLVRLLNRYAAATGSGVIVVFDSSGNVGHSSRQRSGLVTVVYAHKAGKADEEIIRIVSNYKNPSELRVVTSDNRVAYACKHARAATIGSRDFLDLLGETLDVPSQQQEEPRDEPDQKYSPPNSQEVQYWLKQFSKADEKTPKKNG